MACEECAPLGKDGQREGGSGERWLTSVSVKGLLRASNNHRVRLVEASRIGVHGHVLDGRSSLERAHDG